jgi:ABC-type amino acid transport substrate-binding protein
MRSRNMYRFVDLLLLVAAVIVCCSLIGCNTAQSVAYNRDTPTDTLRVGVSIDYPPLIYKSNGHVTGLEAELAQQFAATQDKRVEFIEQDFTDLIPALEKGKIDVIMSGMSVTRPRARRIAFGNAFLRISQKVLVPRVDAHEYRTPWAIMMGQGNVGVVKGTTGSYLAQARLTSATVKQYASAEAGVRALKKGKIKLFIHDSPIIDWLASQHEADGLVEINYPLSQEYLAWAFRKDNDALRNAANQALEDWHSSGELERITEKWVPSR